MTVRAQEVRSTQQPHEAFDDEEMGSELTKHSNHLSHLPSRDRRTKRQRHESRRELDAEPSKRPPCLTAQIISRLTPTKSQAPLTTPTLTGTSMIATIRLVRDPPTTASHIHSAANSNSIQATDAGNDTLRCLKRESTPKHAVRITRIPMGTSSHDRKMFSRDFQKACHLLITHHGTWWGRRGAREDFTSLVATKASLLMASSPVKATRSRSKEPPILNYHGQRERIIHHDWSNVRAPPSPGGMGGCQPSGDIAG